VYSPRHQLHDPSFEVTAGERIPAYELVARAQSILDALEDDGIFGFEHPHEYGLEPIRRVHDDGLIRYLEGAWADWQARGTGTPAIMPDAFLHPGLRAEMGPAPIPTSPCGQAGFWCFDTATPILPGTYEATRAACDAALTAADAVLAGEAVVYALTRPPGHHSAANLFGGYCYFNQAAVAVQWLVDRNAGRVAVLDVDYHHGNGTQQIFYERDDVLYTSIHADPVRAFPYFTGHADEVGAGKGSGTTYNQPMGAGTTDADYLAGIDRSLERINAFAATIVVVSLGFDTYGQDPIGDFSLTTSVYHEVGRRVAASGQRLLLIQEGGYDVESLGRNAKEWLRGCVGEPPAFDSLPTRHGESG
jgi:acetoin utilization deacetylase AcuC-like enzyme